MTSPADAEEPVEFAELVAEAAAEPRTSARWRILAAIVIVAIITAIALSWWLTPLRQWIDVEHLTGFFDRFAGSPSAPFLMIGFFVIGGLAMVPVNLMIAVSVLVFGAVPGAIYALIGASLNAQVLYEIARRLPLHAVQKRLHGRLGRIHRHFVRHGILAVALVRVVPVAPYTIVNLLLGATRIDRIQYIAGTALGMAPGIVVNAFFVDRVVAAVRAPSPLTVALLVLATGVVIGLALFVRRRLSRSKIIG
jgi:phospholipase D1/2